MEIGQYGISTQTERDEPKSDGIKKNVHDKIQAETKIVCLKIEILLKC